MRPGSGAEDRGTTITELLVVMLILGIVVAATATLTIGFQRTNAQNISRQDQIDVARTAVERMSKTVRTAVKPGQFTLACPGCTANSFTSAQDSSMQFSANLDNANNLVGPSRVSYAVATTGVDAGVLIEKVQRPDPPSVPPTGYVYCPAEAVGASVACKATLTTRRLASGVIVAAGAPIFTYWNPAGDQMVPLAGASLGAPELATVLSVELRVKVQSLDVTKAAPTEYIQRVTLPNAQAPAP